MNERITASLAVLLLLTLCLARPLSAGDGVFKPVMVSAPPVIDGKLDDPAWKNAVPLTDFKTFKPDYGKLPSQKTEVYILYDRNYIYFGFRCLDSEPSKIKAAISKRDNIDVDDLIGVVVDTFNDHQSGYLFVVNPLGIQMDGMINADGNGDSSFDTVWRSKGEINGIGYTAEMAIPFKSLRFPPGKKIVMSIAAVRWFSRYSEQASLPAIYPDKGSILTQMMPFELDNIKFQRPVEILPAVTYSQRSVQGQGSLKLDNRTTDFSLTGKLGLTSGLTLDATYNPDFSQVEADAGQIDVNLRYALYYPEKRPFFLEGMENFNFGGRSEANYLGDVVYTRTIVDPVMGFKLNGKMGNQNLVSSIFAVDEYPGRVTRRPRSGRPQRPVRHPALQADFQPGQLCRRLFHRPRIRR